MKYYDVLTFDGGGYFHFLTKAKNSKRALKNLIEKSTDFRDIIFDNPKKMRITIKELK